MDYIYSNKEKLILIIYLNL